MGKDKTVSGTTVLQEMFQVGLYKGSQGRVTRQVTAVALAIIFALASYRLHETLTNAEFVEPGSSVPYVVPVILLLVGLWVSYRAVMMPQFADFLIAVEAEVNKVSWPSWAELIRSSLVVIFVVFFLAFMLFAYDAVWTWIFKAIGVMRQ